jgi:hypothetical protein
MQLCCPSPVLVLKLSPSYLLEFDKQLDAVDDQLELLRIWISLLAEHAIAWSRSPLGRYEDRTVNFRAPLCIAKASG